MAVLTTQTGIHDIWVFPYHNKPIKQITTKAWRKAVAAIGEPGFRFHDLRHTWASWHVQSGTPLHALQILGGWSSYEMVLRYAHLDRQSLAKHTEKLGHILGHTLEKSPEEASQVIDFGAGKRSRTSDLRITNALLYQLSYSGFERFCN